MKNFTIALLVGFFALGPHAFAQPTTPINNARLTGNATVPSGATLTIQSGASIIAEAGSTVTGFGGGGGGSGNVTASGTPTSGQAAEFTTATNIVGVATTGSGSYVKATSPTLVTPALGTPSSVTLTNGTGLPISTGVSGLGTGVGTFLATPSSANLASAVTDETGSGGLVFATSPTFVTNFTLASGTAPTTSSVAQMAFDTNAWATSYGAVQVHNGTTTTYLVGIDSSDTPTNGQVPVWNTGGSITWQDQSGSGGAPTDATYIVQTSNGSLSAEQVLASLSSGIMRVATTTGVITSLTDSAGIAANISDETGSGALVFGTSPSFTTNLTLATSATPTTAAAGAMAFDTDAWGASRGAPQVYDGTANIILLGTLASDTPTNGQVPVWNTGGTITWEAAGSGNVTNNATLATGNVVIGGGTTVVGTSNMAWTAGTNTLTVGNLSVTNNATFGNLTTTDLTISGSITGTIAVTNGGTGRATGTTAYSLIATGTTATGAQQTLANGATTEILVGGGASALPVWTTATGSGAPVRATSPTLVTPTLGAATATSINGLTITSSTGTLTVTNGKTLSVSNTLTLAGTDSTTMTFPGTSQTIVGLTATQTLTGKQSLVSGALGTDDTWEGQGITGLNAGATIAQWEAIYLDGSSTWQLADANGSGTFPVVGLAVAAYSSTDQAVVVYSGTVRNDAWNWTPGGVIYLSTTAGGLTQTAPNTSGDKVQQVGRALTADVMLVNINNEYLTVQ